MFDRPPAAVKTCTSDHLRIMTRPAGGTIYEMIIVNFYYVCSGNKIDHPEAVSEDELRHQLGLYQTTGKGKVPLDGIRPIEVRFRW